MLISDLTAPPLQLLLALQLMRSADSASPYMMQLDRWAFIIEERYMQQVAVKENRRAGFHLAMDQLQSLARGGDPLWIGTRLIADLDVVHAAQQM